MKKIIRKSISFFAFGLLAIATENLPADVKLPAIFGTNMALQAGVPLPIWGTADPGEKVTVTLGDQTVSTEAGADGKWKVSLQPLETVESLRMTVAGKNTLTCENVAVGEVWLCSGQSNMWWPVAASKDAQKEIPAANWPKIRLFTVKNAVAESPLSDVEGQWVECSPGTIPQFSATAYYFGRELHRRLNVPVGLIHSSWQGTPAEPWVRRARLEADPELKKVVEQWDLKKANPEQEKKKYEELVATWEQSVQKAKSDGKPEPRKPVFQDPVTSENRPANLWNAMIAPLIPYAIRGAIWYQGESNVWYFDRYANLFSTLIRDWRDQWGQGEFPFLFVQLANLGKPENEPADSRWARLREAQLKTLSVPNTGMAVNIDADGELHPKNKQEGGLRLALLAMNQVYGKTDVVASGPIFESMKIVGDKVRLRFKSVNGGLASKTEGGVKGFALAGADRKFVWADAQIAGETVVVSSDQVKDPVAVRYGWGDNPEASLSNAACLPASPFRTDSWPLVPPPVKPAP